MSGGQFMVVCIVAMVMIASILKARFQAKHGIIEDEDMLGNRTQRVISNGETERLQDEVRTLKDRIQVLERIATENNSANDLNRQIEELRNR